MPAAAVIPPISRAAAQQVTVLANAKKKKPLAQRNSKYATKQAGVRQQQRVAASNVINKQKTRTSGTQQRQRIRANAAMQQQRVSSSAKIAQDKAQIRQASIDHQRNQSRAIRRNDAIKGTAIRAATNTAETPFRQHDTISLINPIMLIIFTWAGIVIMYALITSPNTSSKFFTSMRTWVGLLYQNKPMFVAKNSTPTGA